MTSSENDPDSGHSVGGAEPCEGAPADQGIEHLQTAAKEMVFAARSFLDAIEGVITDRDKMSAAVGTMTDILETAGESLTSLGDMVTSRSGAKTDAEMSSEAKESRVKRVNLD